MWTNDLLGRFRALGLTVVVAIVAASASIAVAATVAGSADGRGSLGARYAIARAPNLQERHHSFEPRRGLDRERDVVAGPAGAVTSRIGLAETEPARAPDDRQRQAAVKLATQVDPEPEAASAPEPAPAEPAPAPAEPAPEPPPAPAPEPPPPPAPEPPPPAPEPPPPPAPEPPPPPAPEPPAPEPEPPTPEPEPEPEVPAPEPEPEPEVPAPEPEPEPEVPGGETSSLIVGIDGGHSGWSGAEAAARTKLGAAVTRHEWDPSDPVGNEESLVLQAASGIGTRFEALLGGNDLGEPAHYRDWVVEFVRRYGPGGSFWAAHPELDAGRYAIRTIELGNEPYFGAMSPEEYADSVRPALERIDELDLPVRVVLPSWVYGEETDWVDILYDRIPNLNALFDAFAYHPYWYGHDPAEHGAAGPFDRIGTLRERMDELGAPSKPIFLTEYGESTASCGSQCVTEQVQAEHLQSMIDAVATRTEWQVERLMVYQLLDRGTNSPEREDQFGLLREDGSAKPSYSVVSAAIAKYSG